MVDLAVTKGLISILNVFHHCNVEIHDNSQQLRIVLFCCLAQGMFMSCTPVLDLFRDNMTQNTSNYKHISEIKSILT